MWEREPSYEGSNQTDSRQEKPEHHSKERKGRRVCLPTAYQSRAGRAWSRVAQTSNLVIGQRIVLISILKHAH